MTQVLERISLRELCTARSCPILAPTSSVLDAAKSMQSHRRGAVLIVENGRLLGIFTERDLVNRVVAAGLNPQQTILTEVMTRELTVAHPDDSHWVGLALMQRGNIRHLPILADGKDGELIGMVSRRQLVALDNKVLEAELERKEACHAFI